MSSNPPPGERSAEFRRALVATANLAPYLRRRPPMKLVAASLTAFALAGALTGGAIATVTRANSDALAAQTGAAKSAQGYVKTQDGVLIGRPFSRSESGTQTIDVGRKPAGATVLIEGFGCLDPGHIVEFFDSKKFDSFSDCSSGGSGADVLTASGSGDHIFAVQTQKGVRYAIWLSWARIPKFAASAAQRQELADGTVSRDEDLAAFYRFAGCMTALGHPLTGITTGLVPGFSETTAAESDGSDNRCYVTEYGQVDEEWQVEVADGTVGASSVRACPSPVPVVSSTGPQRRVLTKNGVLPVLTGCPWID
jgi:hypothetical protein